MDTNPFFSSYTGAKDFAQPGTPTSNSNGLSAADDYADRGIDLNEQLVKNKPATFFMRVNSDAMIGDGIHVGDVVIVDRSLEAKNGKIIIAVVDGELLIRKLEMGGGRQRLVATKGLAPLELSEGALRVWGVVTYVIHNV
ncbi:MAG TPA: translesion error-prone DNA polymerase V autoproteolytic subunit [Flavisolibacter sp.]|jgi:DNA polymerase V|nr:translesion error-prone DNA polymerase V autoproteolytic subunit [Flavisolibacter sp.]